MAKVKDKLKPIDTPHYKYREAVYKSFYSRLLYVDVGKRWPGYGLLYLLLVVAICSIPLSIKMALEFNETFRQLIVDPIVRIPKVYVQNGQVLFNKPMPYLIKNHKNQVVTIIDTTGTVTKFTNNYPDLSILINKDIIYFKIPTPQILKDMSQKGGADVPLSQKLEKNANFVFDGKAIIAQNSIMQFKYITQAMIYPIVFSLFYSVLVTLFLVFAFLGQVFSHIFFAYKLSFSQASRIFMVASTPMLFLSIILLTLNWIIPGIGFILLAILFIYFSMAVYALKGSGTKAVSA